MSILWSNPADIKLVRPPTSFGQRLCLMGDSIMGNAGIPPAIQQGSYGFTNWLTSLLGERLQSEISDNFGTSGWTSTQILATLPSALASDAAWAIVQGGNNDISAGISPATSISNLTAICAALLNVGKNVCLLGPQARGSAAYTTALKNAFAQINQGLRYWCLHNPGVLFIESRDTLAVPSTSYANTTWTQADSIHPNVIGAKILGQQFATAILPFLPVSADPCLKDLFDLYDSVNNPTGNMLTNGGLISTGGTISTTPSGVLTGTIAGSHVASFNGKAGGTYTGTLVGSLVARSDNLPGQFQQFAFSALSGGNAGDILQFMQSINFPTGLAPGDQVYFASEMIVNHTVGLTGHQLLLKETDGSGNSGNDLYYKKFDNGLSPWPTGAYSLIVKSPIITIRPSNGGTTRTLTPFWQIGVDTNTAPATFTLQIGRMTMRKVKP